jgi:hypothetical protein
VDLEAEVLQSRFFHYRRVGSDERVLELLPGQRVGHGTRWEQVWLLEFDRDRPSLVIGGHSCLTCRLQRDADGIWRGRWLHKERMPVELRPLGDGSLPRASAGGKRAAADSAENN